jgi:hypothetical protein
MAFAACLGSAGPAAGSAKRAGEVVRCTAPGGMEERCDVPARMPGAADRDADLRDERAFGAIDLHGRMHATCPKHFSTSAGTLVYDFASGPCGGNAAGFERNVCRRGHGVENEAGDEPVSFKMSVHTPETSTTFANSALIDDHFARCFDAAEHNPPAAMRTVDRQARVANPGGSLSAGRRGLKQNHAARNALTRAERDPQSYSPADELFTTDRSQVYGVLPHPRDRRCGEEVNGSRESGWGDGQSRDFQQTAPFVALATDAPLVDAMTEAIALSLMGSAIPADSRTRQPIFRMREVAEVTLPDFIFGQQDRIGNIDDLAFWSWNAGSEPRRAPAAGRHPPDDTARRAPKLIRRTEPGDNDAGVRTTDINSTPRTGMLERLRHGTAGAYRRLIAPHRDFGSGGPLHEYVRSTSVPTDAEFARIVADTRQSAANQRESCRAGRLRFDLEPEMLLLEGEVTPTKVYCDNH